MDKKQTCNSSLKVEQSLRKFDWLHFFARRIVDNSVMLVVKLTIASRVCSKTLSCRRLARFKINIRWCLVHVWYPIIRASFVDEQKANISFSLQNKDRNNLLSRGTATERVAICVLSGHVCVVLSPANKVGGDSTRGHPQCEQLHCI